jgi:hypothetical protein
MFTTVKSRTASALMVLALAASAFAPGALARPLDAHSDTYRSQPSQQYQDLRMPDTRDAAEHYHPTLAPEPVDTAGGFDWLSAAIGAAAGTGFMIVAVGLASTGRRRSVLRA